MSLHPTRVVLNFSNRCALSCEWCYVSFGSAPAKKNVVESIVDRVSALGFRVLTLGGGDPFQYSFISSIAERAKNCGIYVHVDTHAKSLRETSKNRLMLINSVDLVGLPLDGGSASIHDAMRGAPGHFNLIVDRVRWLREIGVKFKINTIVSRANIESLPEMARVIAEMCPARWSIYQYMPLGPAAIVSEKHCIDVDEFDRAVSSIEGLSDGSFPLPVEVSNRYARRQTYPIVHHDGTVSVHSDVDERSMRRICSIFDSDAGCIINSSCNGERDSASSRY